MTSSNEKLVTAMSVKMIATITSYDDGSIRGVLECLHFEEPFIFTSLIRMVEVMEATFDAKGYPEKHFLPRTFRKTKQRARRNELDINEHIKKVQTDDLDKEPSDGVESSFEFLVQFRHNAEWQGRIHWIEKGIERDFASIVDLAKLLDDALFGESA